MEKSYLTDEDILSYLIGDCEESVSNNFQYQLKENLELRERFESLAFIKDEMKNTAILHKLKEKQRFNFNQLVKQFALSSIVFSIGLFAQSNFEILSRNNIEARNESVSISAHLSWDNTKKLSLL